MTWSRLSDDYTERMLDVSDAAFRLDIQATVWCNRLLTDGRVLERRLPHIWPGRNDLEQLAEELVEAGRWMRDDKGYLVDWVDQEQSIDVKARRAANTERQRIHRKHKGGDHSECNPRYCKSRNAVTDSGTRSVTDSVSNRTPSRPVPQGTGKGSSADMCPLGHPPLDDSPAYCALGHRIGDEE
ncbi:hypothetical protein ACFUTX_06740 [Microbacterium sp. NPDC057407]|uniref:hypothetical protein n=1 Tax=Microbacterium sp. NPDC057407 TaxID=3346120 RepID=UPI00367297A6